MRKPLVTSGLVAATTPVLVSFQPNDSRRLVPGHVARSDASFPPANPLAREGHGVK
jgi:hypothetical protein